MHPSVAHWQCSRQCSQRNSGHPLAQTVGTVWSSVCIWGLLLPVIAQEAILGKNRLHIGAYPVNLNGISLPAQPIHDGTQRRAHVSIKPPQNVYIDIFEDSIFGFRCKGYQLFKSMIVAAYILEPHAHRHTLNVQLRQLSFSTVIMLIRAGPVSIRGGWKKRTTAN